MAPAYEILTRLPLGYHETLQDHAETRFTREAGVTIGRPLVARLQREDFPPSFLSRVDLDAWHYFSIRFPFDLEEAAPGLRYVEAQYEVALTEVAVIALQLGVVPLAESAKAIPEGEQLTLFGLGHPSFRWRLRAAEHGELAEGSRVARAVMQIPPGLGTLEGVIRVSAVLDDDTLPGRPLDVHEPEPFPFELNLSGGGFTTDPRRS